MPENPLGQCCLAGVEHASDGRRSLMFATIAFVQCVTLDTVSLVVSAFRTDGAVTAPANIFI